MQTDADLITYALRYLADDCQDHRPKTAARMRDLANRIGPSITRLQDWAARGEEPAYEAGIRAALEELYPGTSPHATR